MTGIELSKQCGDKAMQGEKQVEQGMQAYNLQRTVNNVAGFVEEVWDDMGWDKGSIDFRYDEGNGGHASLRVASEDIRPLGPRECDDLVFMVYDALQGTPLKKYVALDAFRSGKISVTVDIQLIHPVTLAREFYEFWQDLSSRGMKELGL